MFLKIFLLASNYDNVAGLFQSKTEKVFIKGSYQNYAEQANKILIYKNDSVS